MNKRIITFLLILVFSISLIALDQESFVQQYGNRDVVEITVNGLRRTSEKTFLNWVETKAGLTVADYDLAYIFKRIDDKGLFALNKEVEFFPTENDAVMMITVSEKFSLFAVPFFNSVDGDKMYGGAALDSNFLGYGATLLGVGAFGKNDITTFLLLTQDEMFNNEYAGKIIVNYRTNEIEMTDIYENEPYYESKQKTINLGASIGKKFMNKNLTLGPDLEWQKIKMDNEAGNLEKDANLLFPGLLISYDNTEQNFVFRDGFKVESLTSRVFSLDDNYDDFFRSTSKISYSTTYDSKINFSLKSTFGLFDRPDNAEDVLSGFHGSKSIPNMKVWADDWINGAFVLEHALMSKFKLNSTMSYYYEAGYYNNDGLDEKYQGLGSEFKIYFDKVAIPAIGFGLAYNLTNEQTIFTFSFGMGGQ